MSNDTLTDILNWSTKQPAWQRDALRRLFVEGELDEDDLEDLVDLCRAASGLAPARAADVLTKEHLRILSGGSQAVSLLSLTHHFGVNALGKEQTITFGPQLSIVFGQNAAGKSGYTRVLKRACRSRSKENILGNVLIDTKPVKPRVTITFKDGVNEVPYSWDVQAVAHESLSAVSVFDSHCAPVYLRDKTDVAFRPFGLDIFDKLGQSCMEVRARLERERDELNRAVANLPLLPEGTRARSILDNLTQLSSVDDIRALATLSDAEANRLKELRTLQQDAKATNPRARAQEISFRATRVDALANHAHQLMRLLGAEALANLREALAVLTAARVTLGRLKDAALTEDLLPGTGDTVWRQMWDATSHFSHAAYATAVFPVLEHDAKCPFCQQTINKTTAARLQRLRDYVTSDAQLSVRQSETAYQRLISAVRDQVVERPELETTLNEIALDNIKLSDFVREFLKEAAQVRDSILQSHDHSSALPKRELSTNPEDELRNLGGSLRERAKELQAQATGMSARAVTELAELESRTMLADQLQRIIDEIERKKRIAAYDQCLKDAATQAITRKSTELTKSLVTEHLQETFQNELSKLEFTHLLVEIKAAGGTRGAMTHQLAFTNAPGTVVTDVLSEGESRTLSLAAFLTELSTSSSRSSIIFDDPVSSLDHIWRERIARRLVEEARDRQVIVFTHDLLFLHLLKDRCERTEVSCHSRYVWRHDTEGAGLCSGDIPWLAMSVKQRIAYLRNEWQGTEKVHRTESAARYESQARVMYGQLREVWEQAIEDILLNGVVERYRPSVETQRIRHLHDITEADCKTIDDEMTECSRWVGHDQAAADGTPIPKPDGLKRRIDVLDEWVAGITKRRKQK